MAALTPCPLSRAYRTCRGHRKSVEFDPIRTSCSANMETMAVGEAQFKTVHAYVAEQAVRQ
jgi:hypothetical protein